MLAHSFKIFDGSVDNFGERYEKIMHQWSNSTLVWMPSLTIKSLLSLICKSNCIALINYRPLKSKIDIRNLALILCSKRF